MFYALGILCHVCLIYITTPPPPQERHWDFRSIDMHHFQSKAASATGRFFHLVINFDIWLMPGIAKGLMNKFDILWSFFISYTFCPTFVLFYCRFFGVGCLVNFSFVPGGCLQWDFVFDRLGWDKTSGANDLSTGWERLGSNSDVLDPKTMNRDEMGSLQDTW